MLDFKEISSLLQVLVCVCMNQAESWSAAPIMLEKVQFQQVNVQTRPSNQTCTKKVYLFGASTTRVKQMSLYFKLYFMVKG